MPKCPLEIRASPSDNALGAQYFVDNKDKIRAELLKYGAIWFRGFDLMKSVKGHRLMYESLGLDPCLDPLHSSGLRKFASERDALYEEVRDNSFFVCRECRRVKPLIGSCTLNAADAFHAGEQAIAPWSLHRIAL